MNPCVYEDRYFQIVAPALPLNCREDGGHLVIAKKEPVTDRSDLTWQEAIASMRISMAAGRAMYDVLGIERMNYEDFGNWGIDDPGGAKTHRHFSEDRESGSTGSDDRKYQGRLAVTITPFSVPAQLCMANSKMLRNLEIRHAGRTVRRKGSACLLHEMLSAR
jgi:hypothetical protein